MLAAGTDITEEFKSSLMYPNIACKGATIGVSVDLDGKNNGTQYDPDETMVTFYSARGQAYGEKVGSNQRYVFTPHTNSSCNTTSCAGGCDRGRIAIAFVDITKANFDPRQPSTWTYKSMDEVVFEMWNDGTVTTNSPTTYQQAKAYKTQSAPQSPARADLIDSNPRCDGQPGSTTNCSFSDLDDGIAEIWITTDYAENILDQVTLTQFIIDLPSLPPGTEVPPFPPPVDTQPIPELPPYAE